MKNSVVQYLDDIERRYGDKVALEEQGASVTFTEYRNKALAIGSHILKTFGKRRCPVIVYLPKGIYALSAFMGILYSGNFYCPIPYRSPEDRAARIYDISGAEYVITDRKHLDTVKSFSIPDERIHLIEDALETEIDIAAIDRTVDRVIDTDAAYLLFTSGSTGMPKGVTVPHRAVIDYMEWVTEEFSIDSTFVFANQAPFHFDASMPDIYMPLFTGCTLFVASEKLFMFPGRLVDELNNHHVNALTWVPSALMVLSNQNIFEKKKPNELRLCMFCGEVMPNKHLNIWRKHFPNTVYVNLYGPTEAAYACTYYVIDREFADDEPLPLGRGCRNTDMMLIGDDGKEIEEPNQIGELCIRGSSLALGYYGQMEHPAFTNDPTHTHYPEKIYHTGDLAWRSERGELMFGGRKDNQIKHMGYRIELGEIETAVLGLHDVRNAACLFNAAEDKIVLFYEADEALDRTAILNGLASRLPAYMLPADFRRFDRMPMNMNDKVDRVKLKTML